MSALHYWLKAIATDLIVAAIAFMWMFRGSEGAGNIFMFTAWAVIVIRLSVSIFGDKTWFKSKRPAGFDHYHAVTELSLIAFMAWFGMMWTAGFYAFASAMAEATRNREPSTKKGDA